MKTNSLIALILVLVLIGIGVYFFIGGTSSTTPALPTSEETSQTEPDLTASLNFPATLPTTYIRPVDWPPLVQTVAGGYLCEEAGEETARAGETKERVIDGVRYCITKVSEGAAGSIFTQYAYVVERGEALYAITFSTRSPQCGNYEEEEMNACQEERDSFDMDQYIHQIIQSS